jgi:hypothetical protein
MLVYSIHIIMDSVIKKRKEINIYMVQVFDKIL